MKRVKTVSVAGMRCFVTQGGRVLSNSRNKLGRREGGWEVGAEIKAKRILCKERHAKQRYSAGRLQFLELVQAVYGASVGLQQQMLKQKLLPLETKAVALAGGWGGVPRVPSSCGLGFFPLACV